MAAGNVLITGAGGFLGSHLVDHYLNNSTALVTGLDNYITGSAQNLREASSNDRFSFLSFDVSQPWDAIEARVRSRGSAPDLILHFASPASPVDYAEHPLETMAVNSSGTQHALEAARRWNARFLFASTSECYGDPLEHPQRETYWGNVNSFGPRACYDESKRFGEALTYSYLTKHGVDARIVRIFNTYGPRMRLSDGRVVPNFITQALKGRPLTIFGNGKQTRSFCFVDDLVEGIVRCAASDGTRGIVVNLGNPEEHAIAEFARIVSDVVGVPLQTTQEALPVDDPGRRCPDITRARELLGWEPKIGLAEGLERTIRYFSERAAVVTDSR
ncbi:MAG: NAD-dependent epimerase/dehydratase family protein [Vulcanimicrobiaceae bacterium]